ncbi:type I pullulanase [Paenibacillus glufosinatiresistens]|uniref:type I pullulanase n=1 Tax=Paenibacillus glufosinatiresistens TaxID=3070657 RepID=UPI00286E5319|nr:type I pullulanase [Paenibacillus sp. YX.27]
MSVQREMEEPLYYGDPAATGGVSVFDPAFDEMFAYDGGDLGVSYSPEATTFKLWAPTALEAEVALYDAGTGGTAERLAMSREARGVWSLAVNRNLEGAFYTFRVRLQEDRWQEAADPYARAVGVNGDRGAILDLRGTDPEGWAEDRVDAEPLEAPTDAVIYELHVRDLSIHPASGISAKGKFAGLAESGTRGPGGIRTGLDHIADLGVTHVQLLPVYDYSTESVDESRLDEPQFNWGYDPKNYNVPEGSYATDPYVPGVRIRELKEMIQALHRRGLRVIMDVVYNHVYDGYRANFSKLVPGYYLRYAEDGTLSNGSGCGNDNATERIMMSRFIVESVLYWAKEYHFDGFRFDLMGLMDYDTINEVRRRLDEIDPTIMTIGEGWIIDTELDTNRLAHQKNSKEMPRIGQFSDDFRDTVKGDIFIFDRKGFVSGARGFERKVKTVVAGGIPFAPGLAGFAHEPDQSVNYVECHDNHTLWDKLVLSNEDAGEEHLRALHRLASAMVMTSQGIAFLHAGQEFMRTKGGVENSYKSPDEVNWLDWERCAERQDDVAYMKRLISLRLRHPAFRLRKAEDIRHHLFFEPAPLGTVAYTLRGHAGGDAAEHLFVAYIPKPEGAVFELPELGDWKPIFGDEILGDLSGSQLTLTGAGMAVVAVLPQSGLATHD